MFPNPEQIRALTSKSEDMAEGFRSLMPFSNDEILDPNFIGHRERLAYEKRKATPNERKHMEKAEEAVDVVFRSFNQEQAPKIVLEHIIILQKPQDMPPAEDPAHDFNAGGVGAMSHIYLDGLNEKSPDGARAFLHSTVHEFFHAKSLHRWTIGERTTLRRVGFYSQTSHLISHDENTTETAPSGDFFESLNEGMTEILTGIACQFLHASPWFQNTQKRNEHKTAPSRKLASQQYAVLDSAISNIVTDAPGEYSVNIPYHYEQSILHFIMKRISEETGKPLKTVLKDFQQDYADGTMRRITPILHQTFGPDILRVLSLWQHGRNPASNKRVLERYLQAKDPENQKVLAHLFLQAIPAFRPKSI